MVMAIESVIKTSNSLYLQFQVDLKIYFLSIDTDNNQPYQYS